MSDQTPSPDEALKAHLLEYERLKFEQVQRIGFRDNLLYFTLGATGAVSAFALGAGHHAAWLFVPIIGVVLGWTYLANDTKITGIGRYVAGDLKWRIDVRPSATGIFGWEDSPRKSPRRDTKKPIQLLVDLLAFALPGLLAPIAYMIQQKTTAWWAFALGAVIWAFVLRVAAEIVYESDINKLSDLMPIVIDWRLKTQKDRPRPALTVDIAALAGSPPDRVLLIRRGKPPFESQWALPGGHVEQRETVARAAVRELEEETGISILETELRLVGIYDAPDRDPRGWFISIAYVATLPSEVAAVGADDAVDAQWHRLNALPTLAFDHAQIMANALKNT